MNRGEENPAARVRRLGARAASIIDLVAVAFSRRESDVALGETMAQRIMARFHNVQGLGEASTSELAEFTGFEPFEILRAQSQMELGRRAANSGKGPVSRIGGPEDVATLLDYLRVEKKEHFVAILLDAKSNVLRTSTIHIGTLTSSVVGPREVFREAVREGASTIIVAHNHPSGDPEPSPEDIAVTRELVKIGRVLDIHVVDHVIIGDRRHVSLANRGLIE